MGNMYWVWRTMHTHSFPAPGATHHPLQVQLSLTQGERREVLKARVSPFVLDSSETPNIPQHLAKQPGSGCRSLARETD